MYAEVVALLRLYNVWAIFALQDSFGAVLDEFRVALYSDRDEDLRLRVRSRDVEGDIVEVGDYLID